MGKAKVIWTETALEDVNEIGAFIAQDSVDAALGFTERLFEATDRLEDHPLSGALIEENPALRHVIVSGYRIIYRTRQDTVEIVTVLGPGQDAKKRLHQKGKK